MKRRDLTDSYNMQYLALDELVGSVGGGGGVLLRRCRRGRGKAELE